MAVHSTLEGEVSHDASLQRLNVERICQVITLLVGARSAFSGRNLPLGADGIAYMDLARAYARYDWHTAVNGYWSPFYAWLLAIGMRFLHPGIRSEFVMARTLNFILFAAALYAFSRFWRSVADWSLRSSEGETTIPAVARWVWIVLGYWLFVTSFVWYVDNVNPDILVATIVLAIAARLFEFNDGRPVGAAGYAGLGLLLAAGYYAKTIMLYFALFILGAMVLQGFRSGTLRKPIVAALVFVALVSPYVAILSRTLGHLTAGDSGRLTYAWFVNANESKAWLTELDTAGPKFYPGPVIFEAPRVFFLPSIAGVTYAPWYDPSRFDKLSHPILNLGDQLRRLAVNLQSLREFFLAQGAVLTVPLLILVWYTPKASLRHFAATWFCTLPAAAVFGLYLLIILVPRYVLGFSLVLWGAAWASIFVPPGLQLLARRAMLAGILVVAAYTMPGLLHFLVSRPAESTRGDMAIAEAISRYGIAPGDPLASIGEGRKAYWAYLAKVSVVAEIWSADTDQFWSARPEVQQAALRSMAHSGAKAAVWRKDSDQPCPPRWLSLPENSGCMILLP